MEICFEKPTLQDVPEMLELVESEVHNGTILFRSFEEIANTIDNYIVSRLDGKIIGFCALHIYSATLAEVRSLIVAQEYRKQQIGRTILEFIIQKAKEFGIAELLALSYHRDFFLALGFEVIPNEKIPIEKIQTDCMKCKRFSKCNEIALLKKL
ncbi:hypothetical protein BBW65_01130 [Helicobacter enhydrae]|uniref:N-acetyltransferase domain-containing protein n=2 Tax=Helicobacter enhydrae TaxID=222136 RepID=A0A1B1U420_9HELI|nr:hypothetical protein BBW65_01130 [Helicobacter enhydrae]